jgi:hypothetical protein
MRPARSILDASFRYVPSFATPVAKTWQSTGWRPTTHQERMARQRGTTVESHHSHRQPCQVRRPVFIRTAKGKERMRPSLAPGNVEKTMTAPVTVIVAYDLQFYKKLPKLFAHNPGMRDLFVANPALVEVTARRNSSLQGAYLILAARALGVKSQDVVPSIQLEEADGYGASVGIRASGRDCGHGARRRHMWTRGHCSDDRARMA